MTNTLTPDQRRNALGMMTLLAWDVPSLAARYGLSVDQMAAELTQARSERREAVDVSLSQHDRLTEALQRCVEALTNIHRASDSRKIRGEAYRALDDAATILRGPRT